ncbi:crocetin glucosyltransferase 3-like [Magnolia sinica]|uniref:crocetin glucosyltransferase 3-like n=1 Tax=Magnolia sinica TaxID=86752 RepID=UPI002658D780|nr:crocetin glucosyltransferase 3-like [Magnolia sinica]
MASTTSNHVILFPFMTQGHLNPFLAFAHLLERHTQFTITIVNTPLNVQNLRNALPSDTTIRLMELPFDSSEHGLPPNSENNETLPGHLYSTFFHATLTLEATFERQLIDICRRDGHPPLCIISDMFFGWTVSIAKRLGILHAVFLTGGAYSMAGYLSLWLHLQRQKDSNEFGLVGYPETFRLHHSQLDGLIHLAHADEPYFLSLKQQISLSLGSESILCNTVEEMETTGLELLPKLFGLPVWPVGPLVPSLIEPSTSRKFSRTGKEPTVSSDQCVAWLNLHPPSSVLYIDFGYQNHISTLQMMELAMGLESSGKAFIWVLNPPMEHEESVELRPEWLPKGFEDRMKERKQGLLIYKCAPQLEILSHKSTGAFLSHCVWNLVLESLSLVVPIIGWPLQIEQFFNSTVLVELGVCLEMVIGVEENAVSREVERVVGLVMGGTKKGEEMKRKAIAISEMLKAAVRDDGGEKGSSVSAIGAFFRWINQRKMLE